MKSNYAYISSYIKKIYTHKIITQNYLKIEITYYVLYYNIIRDYQKIQTDI